MSTYFFYGTLQDPEIAREILGRPLSGCSPQPCVLEGYKRVYVADATYPAIAEDAESKVEGLLVARISPLEASRLSRYEGRDYKTEELDVVLRGRADHPPVRKLEDGVAKHLAGDERTALAVTQPALLRLCGQQLVKFEAVSLGRGQGLVKLANKAHVL